MRARTRLTALLVAVATASALTACGQSDDGSAQNVPTVTPATPAESPADAARPAGAVVAADAARAVVAGHGQQSRVALLSNDGRTVQIFTDPGAPGAPAPTSVPVPGLAALTASGDGFVGAGESGIVRIDPAGSVTVTKADLPGALSVATTEDGRTLVGTDRGHVLVLDRDGQQQRDIGGFVRVDDITVAPATAGDRAGQVVVLDRAQSAVTPVDIDSGELKAALRAGDGATTSIVDRYGRVLVAGTRNNEVYAFYGQPIVMRMRAPVADSPYALAFDDRRNLLWVSSTATNEIAAYDVSTGEVIEKHRFASVPQVTSMDVDPVSGSLLAASGRDGSLQVIAPDAVR
ncbi:MULTISPECIES: YncE family protein [Gordonia]|uniref:Lipoprotein n=1 Tax=Gordonia sihwensis NBRC 108236 TaxID=1223544 RepID=L7LFY4_9ACTN|nr:MULTISPECIES: hypothetical protein [Gordonia]AUH69033.1 hypothetical protein CXX93_12605 [Gordonia sp. YC-JH1]MBY4568570.1 hypothetical protein [Gordonia sihwensis]GAC59656.1 hypothetical protein GSI01S_03_01160 [Gordonia sihwensis NBRC 108236]